MGVDAWKYGYLTIEDNDSGEILHRMTQPSYTYKDTAVPYEKCFECGCYSGQTLNVAASSMTYWNMEDPHGTGAKLASATRGNRAVFCTPWCTVCGEGSASNVGSIKNCQPCNIGFYSDTTSTDSCVSCGPGASTAAVGSTSASDCICGANSRMDFGSGKCIAAATVPTHDVLSAYDSASEGSFIDLEGGSVFAPTSTVTTWAAIEITKALTFECLDLLNLCNFNGLGNKRVMYINSGVSHITSLVGLMISRGRGLVNNVSKMIRLKNIILSFLVYMYTVL